MVKENHPMDRWIELESNPEHHRQDIRVIALTTESSTHKMMPTLQICIMLSSYLMEQMLTLI